MDREPPDIDPEPSEQDLAAARALISAEASSSSEPPAVEPTSLTLTPALAAELQRVGASQPLPPLDLSRYEAQEPPASSGDPADVLGALSDAYVSASYLDARAQNLGLLDKWGKNAWLIGNHEMEAELRQLEEELAATKKEIDIVNLERRRRQEEVKGEVELLEEGWKKGVGRVLETEIAVEELKAKIREELRHRDQPLATQ